MTDLSEDVKLTLRLFFVLAYIPYLFIRARSAPRNISSMPWLQL
ncbi:hypothetical protein PITC_070590 [Penicillium italicum]|uniref:Uncharacterized protein n=1 Tax=Penicillium italicum TaxID=40296 RepID=A0A0A2KKX1_PENIT|nr:hypothetical protein PITC_070590 [Penicillium italicum]